MTDNEIVCAMLAYSKTNILSVNGELISIGDILDIINRKNAEVKKLKTENTKMRNAMPRKIKYVEYNAHKEFADRFIKNLKTYGEFDAFAKMQILDILKMSLREDFEEMWRKKEQ